MQPFTILKDYTKNADRFFKHSPTLIGCAAGYQFYEHPLHGDESPLVAHHRATGQLVLTSAYEMDDILAEVSLALSTEKGGSQ